MPKLRWVRRRSLTRGLATLSSIQMNAPRKRTATILSLTMNGDENQSSLFLLPARSGAPKDRWPS